MPAYESLQVINPSGPGFLLIYFFVPLSFLWKLESIQSSVLDSKGVQEICQWQHSIISDPLVIPKLNKLDGCRDLLAFDEMLMRVREISSFVFRFYPHHLTQIWTWVVNSAYPRERWLWSISSRRAWGSLPECLVFIKFGRIWWFLFASSRKVMKCPGEPPQVPCSSAKTRKNTVNTDVREVVLIHTWWLRKQILKLDYSHSKSPLLHLIATWHWAN